MSKPTYEQFVLQEAHEVRAAYKRRNGFDSLNESDLAHCAWRRLEERWTHRDILHDILGEALEDGGAGGDLATDAPPRAAIGPLSIDGAYFMSEGKVWRWTGLTAFLLWKRFLTGRRDEALRYMDWAADLGVNVLRVFSQVEWDGVRNGVEVGFKAADFTNYVDAGHDMLTRAEARGLRVELVAHTFRYDLEQMLAHSRLVDDIASAHVNALFEDANEPPVNGIPLDALVQRFTPRTLASSGQYDPTPYPARRWVNDHPPRDDQFSRKFKGGVEFGDGSGPYTKFTPAWHGPVVLDEPARIEAIGDPDEWRAFGAGAALFCAGATIHGGTWAQTCTPDGAPMDKVTAFLEGMRSVPLQRYSGYGHPDDAGSLRRYTRRGDDGKTYEISVRPFGLRTV